MIAVPKRRADAAAQTVCSPTASGNTGAAREMVVVIRLGQFTPGVWINGRFWIIGGLQPIKQKGFVATNQGA